MSISNLLCVRFTDIYATENGCSWEKKEGCEIKSWMLRIFRLFAFESKTINYNSFVLSISTEN